MTAHPLHGRIRWVFIGQALAALGLIVIATVVGSGYLRDRILKQRAVEESIALWQRLERNPDAVMPRTTGLAAYFVPQAKVEAGLPAALRAFPPGQHIVTPGRWRVVQVSERPQGRLYVFVNPGLTTRLVNNIVTLFSAVAAFAVGLLAWASYRRVRDLVTPVRLLSEQMRAWDPQRTQTAPWHEPAVGMPRSQEVEILRTALIGVDQRMRSYIDRERRFTRDASHELRTPLTVARMATEQLQDEPLSARGQRSLGRILQATRDMEELVDTFLLLARDPSVAVEGEDVDVLEIAFEQAAKARELLGEREVRIEVLDHAEPTVHAPPRILGVIIAQLLRNAVRFTERGSIQIVVEQDRFAIRDTGIGMDQATLERAFEPFYRADIADSAAKGMGLAVVKHLVDRFGWQLTIDSTPGQGTQVSVQFA